jgi:transposase
MTRYPDADHLAAAAGLAPVLYQTGRTHFVTRPLGGNKALKRVAYQSAFATIKWPGASRTYYDRRRAEGKSHQQAVLALAKERLIVLHAMLRDQRPYHAPLPSAPDGRRPHRHAA